MSSVRVRACVALSSVRHRDRQVHADSARRANTWPAKEMVTLTLRQDEMAWALHAVRRAHDAIVAERRLPKLMEVRASHEGEVSVGIGVHCPASPNGGLEHALRTEGPR